MENGALLSPRRFLCICKGSRCGALQNSSGVLCRLTPLLRGVREEAREGAYTLVLEFETKEQMTLEMWETRLNKIETFFGPGINAEVRTIS